MRLYPATIETEMPLQSSMLVTVDMQFLNAHPDWGCGREAREAGINELDAYFDSVRSILTTVREVQDDCRRAGLPLLHLRTACQRADQQDSGRRRHPNRGPMAALGSQESQFLPEVAPAAEELVVSKTSWGAFNSTEIERYLRAFSITHLILVGVVTNGCVELTARDALDRGFQVTVISDATTTRTPALHRDALQRLRASGARIQTAWGLREELAPAASRDL